MLSWILITILAQFLYSIVSIVDKYLVSNTILKPIAYTFYVGIFQVLFLALIPITGFTFPESKYLIVGILNGSLFILALLVFYRAVWLSEVSRIIPIIGGAIPIFTFFLAYAFLNEKLSFWQFIAFLFFVLGGVLMSSKFTVKDIVVVKGFYFAIFAAFLFAIYYSVTKFLFLHIPFIDGFMILQVGGFLGALALLISSKNRKIIFSTPKTIKKKTTYLFISNKILAALAAVMIFYAISIKESDVAIINSLQAIQYVFLLIFAFILSKKLPNLYNEQVGKKVIAQKLLAIGLIGVGLVLLVG